MRFWSRWRKRTEDDKSTTGRMIARNLVEAIKSGSISGKQVLLLLHRERQRLFDIVDTDKEIAELAEHPGWAKLRDKLLNQVEALHNAEHDIAMVNPEQFWLNWFEMEAIVTLIGTVEQRLEERDSAVKALELFDRIEGQYNG